MRYLHVTGFALALAAAGIALTTAPHAQQSTQATQAAGETTLGQDGLDYMRKTLAAGGASLQMSQLAVSKASNSYVKQFAKAEVAEQTTIAEVLRSVPGAPEVPGPAADDAATIQALEKVKKGAEFDRMYVQAQIAGHKKLQGLQSTGSRLANREVMNYAKLAGGQIENHIEILTGLQTYLKTRK